jgi:cytochrome c peroxidase
MGDSTLHQEEAMSPFRTLLVTVVASAVFVACADDPMVSPDGPSMQSATVASNGLTDIEQLGKSIFFDDNLSLNQNQSCAACHAPEVGFTGPISDINAHGSVYEGSVLGRFGNRKPPSAAYATPSPILDYVLEKGDVLFVGGNFWDGRATGEKLGNPAADQAQGPFLNPVEQALPDNACVVYRVCNPVVAADYPVSFEDVFPEDCDIVWPTDVETACAEGNPVGLSTGEREKVEASYDDIALSIAAYEASSEVNPYSSKFDYYLAGMVNLTKEEKKGLQMFKAKGKCAACHILDAGPNGEPPLFTDFTYDNLGVPRNPENPWYGQAAFNPDGPNWIDDGLGGFLDTREDYEAFAEDNMGKQKVPTLRNVDKRPSNGFVKAFGHNGYFKSLEQIVHFYNTRDAKNRCPDPFTTAEDAMDQNCWPAPEVEENVNDDELGNLHLTDDQEKAIVAFLKTLSDGYVF